jgi:hypothetical protein
MTNSRAAPFKWRSRQRPWGETSGASREIFGARVYWCEEGALWCEERAELSGASLMRGEKREKGQLDERAMENSRRWDTSTQKFYSDGPKTIFTGVFQCRQC